MYNIITKINVNPVSDLPYEVLIKIEFEDQCFQEKILQLSMTKNIRLDIKKTGAFQSLLSGVDMKVYLIEDEAKNINYGYLEDYVLNGFVYGFSKEESAEEFSENANSIMIKFLDGMNNEYIKAKYSKYNSN